MQVIELESRSDYELYARNEVAKMDVSKGLKKAIMKLIMHSFDSGVKLTQGQLTVELFG